MSNCQTSVYIYSFFFSYLCAPPIREGRPPGAPMAHGKKTGQLQNPVEMLKNYASVKIFSGA